MPLSHQNNKGFTLIELSIVLVIIGLIVGGVFVGKDLIAASEIRGTIGQVDKYKAAYQTFRLKYNCIPGDCADANQFGLPAGYYTSYDGDGDGLIYSYNDGSTLPSTHPKFAESWGANAHLGGAGLIENIYTRLSGATTSNLPIDGAYMWFTSLRPDTMPTGYTAPDSAGNYLYISSFSTNNAWPALVENVLEPEQAFAIDSKADDGLPMSGAIRAANMQNSTCPGVTSVSNWGVCFNAAYTTTTALYPAGVRAAAPVDGSVTPPAYHLNAPEPSPLSSGYISATKIAIHIRVD